MHISIQTEGPITGDWEGVGGGGGAEKNFCSQIDGLSTWGPYNRDITMLEVLLAEVTC